MYALASFGVVPGLLGLRAFVLGFCVAGAALQALQGALIALASSGVVLGLLGLRAFVLAFCVAGAAL